MKNRQWNQEFPDVPDLVHQTVLDTLANLEDHDEINNKKAEKGGTMRRIKTRTILLAAALIVALGTTVVASELFRWNEKATDIYEAEPELQNRLTIEGIAVEEHQAVTNNGLTITAIQTIQDSNCFYALFEVAASDTDIQIDEDCSMDYLLDFYGAEDPFMSRGWGFVDRYRQETGNSRYFEIFGTKMEENAADMHLGIHFTALKGPGQKAMDGDVLISGDWNFDLTVHPAASVHVDLNKEIPIAGCPVRVESVELSPLTCRLTCNGADIQALAEKEGVNFNQLDSLTAMDINGVKYQDGTVVREHGYNTLWESFPAEGSYEKVLRFDRVIEPEKVCGILLGEQGDEIPLQ